MSLDYMVKNLLENIDVNDLTAAGTRLVLEHLDDPDGDTGPGPWTRFIGRHDLTGTDLARAAAANRHHQVRAQVWTEHLLPHDEAVRALREEPSQAVRAAIVGSYDMDQDIAAEALKNTTFTAARALLDINPLLAAPERVPASVWVDVARHYKSPNMPPRLRENLLTVLRADGRFARAAATTTDLFLPLRLTALEHPAVTAEEACEVLSEVLSVWEPHPVTGHQHTISASDALTFRPALKALIGRPVLTTQECDLLQRIAPRAFASVEQATMSDFLNAIAERREVPWSVDERRRMVAECADENSLLELVSQLPDKAVADMDGVNTVMASPHAGPRTLRAVMARSDLSLEHVVGCWTGYARLWEDLELGLELLSSPARVRIALRGLEQSGFATELTRLVAAGEVAIADRLWDENIGWDGDLDELVRRIPLAVVMAGRVGDPLLAAKVLDRVGQFLTEFGASEVMGAYKLDNPGVTLGDVMDAHAAATS
jgi:hypothetical protein